MSERRRTPLLAWLLVAALVLVHFFWRPDSAALLFGWLPVELAFRLAYIVVAWLAILYLARVIAPRTDHFTTDQSRTEQSKTEQSSIGQPGTGS